jgi:hypothetical protein
MIRLRISPDGCIRGLWTDDVGFAELGTMQVRRASHVEFDEMVCAFSGVRRTNATAASVADWRGVWQDTVSCCHPNRSARLGA